MTAPPPVRYDCDDVVRRLWPHLDGALPESERAAVVAHLEACGGCRSHYDFARAFLEAVGKAAPRAEDFAALRRRVEGAIAAERARSD